ncbi:hypothetical protein HH308_04575 [Gordonia sp. TBRC 11910]|uniref:Uncharacterized protein n=1 Tax=Gordonia asplenii TaxID=2725283 RepID=A0A848KYH2_9ACTN|nr:hypothetical protein [Gordonia asplenii]NMO00488.1 hypothetical protein [Gordonia asplenii]
MTVDGETDDRTEDSAHDDRISPRELAIEWHPDALRPNFEWSVALPTDWAVLQTHPSLWQRQNERIVDDYYGGKRVAARVRRALLRSLEDAVAVTQKNRVLLTLIRPGVDAEGRIENVALNVMFTSSSPRLASMAPIRKALETKPGTTEELTTPSGNAYVVFVRTDEQQDGDTTRESVSVQAFYPLPSTTWTLVVGTTAPRPDLTEALRDMVIRLIASVSWGSDAVPTEPAPAADLPDAVSLVSYRVNNG